MIGTSAMKELIDLDPDSYNLLLRIWFRVSTQYVKNIVKARWESSPNSTTNNRIQEN